MAGVCPAAHALFIHGTMAPATMKVIRQLDEATITNCDPCLSSIATRTILHLAGYIDAHDAHCAAGLWLGWTRTKMRRMRVDGEMEGDLSYTTAT
jgi:hypothetical protein